MVAGKIPGLKQLYSADPHAKIPASAIQYLRDPKIIGQILVEAGLMVGASQ